MSDQISEKMARKIYDAQKNYDAPGLCSGWERFLGACKGAGLIKPSKLDDVRQWVQDVSLDDKTRGWFDGRRVGVRECAAQYEQAIKELEERK